jgi:transcription antitermination factor NusG
MEPTLGLTSAELCRFDSTVLPADVQFEERQWLAVYTRTQHENTVARQLETKSFPFLLPQFIKTSRWSDRVKRSMAQLFPRYIFVNVDSDDRVRVLQTAGVVSIVSVGGKPSPLPPDEVTKLQECTARPCMIEPHPYLKIGRRVRVTHGPFEGWEGILAARKNSTRLVVNLDSIVQSFCVDLDGADIEAV